MSGEQKDRDPITYASIIAEVEETRGMAILKSLSEPHGRDLPIRNPDTGAVLAYVPETLSDGLRPLAVNGYVVGYYRDDELAGETLYPIVLGYEVVGLASVPYGERWIPVFDPERGGIGGVRVT